MTHWQKSTGGAARKHGTGGQAGDCSPECGSFQGRRTGNRPFITRQAGGRPSCTRVRARWECLCPRAASQTCRFWAFSWRSAGALPKQDGGGQTQRVRTPTPLCMGRRATDRRCAPTQRARPAVASGPRVRRGAAEGMGDQGPSPQAGHCCPVRGLNGGLLHLMGCSWGWGPGTPLLLTGRAVAPIPELCPEGHRTRLQGQA